LITESVDKISISYTEGKEQQLLTLARQTNAIFLPSNLEDEENKRPKVQEICCESEYIPHHLLVSIPVRDI